jgi:hypothetical protein
MNRTIAVAAAIALFVFGILFALDLDRRGIRSLDKRVTALEKAHNALEQQHSDVWAEQNRKIGSVWGAVSRVKAAQAAVPAASAVREPAKKKPRVFSRMFDR